MSGASRQPGRHVVFVMGGLVEYRTPFYEGLRAALSDHDIRISVLYEPPRGDDLLRGNLVDLEWGQRITPRILEVGNRELIWHPHVRTIRDADLVVVLQQSKLLLNYWLLVLQQLGRTRVAFWGHGRNLQSATASRLGEAVKRRISRMPHWWFAYNDFSARIVEDLGYPSERITSVQNAIDTRRLTTTYQALQQDDLQALMAELGIASDNVGISIGSLDAEKRIPFLLDAASHVRGAVDDFELIVVGGGQAGELVEQAARTHSWIHYVGPRHGLAKVPYFALARALLIPGRVGLGVLDSFALETPLIASTSAEHSPEIDYLDSGVNGLMVEDGGDPAAYAEAVARYLREPALQSTLREACRAARHRYTIEEMVARFAQGILAALEEPTPVRYTRA